MAQSGKPKTKKMGEDAGTGRIKSVPAAKADKEGSIVRTVPAKGGAKGGKRK